MHDSAQFVIRLASGEYVTPAGDSTPDIYLAETFDSYKDALACGFEVLACLLEVCDCGERFEVVTR